MALHSTQIRRAALTAAIAAVLGMAALGLAGCAAITGSQPTQADYPTWSDVHPANQQTSTSLPVPPAFVPHDATQILVRALPTGASILTFTSTQQPDPTLCHSGTLTGSPKLDANWWPIGKRPAQGLVCSPGWQLFTVSGVTYGWTPAS